MEMTELLYWALALALIAIGFAGSVLPALPGLPCVFGGLWLIAWRGNYLEVGSITLVALAVLLAIGLALDFIASSLGVKKVGASPQAVTGATLGTLVGVFFGIPGLIIGPFAGAVLGELKAQQAARRTDPPGAARSAGGVVSQAAASGIGAWIGLILGILTKLVIALMMIGIFVFDYLL